MKSITILLLFFVFLTRLYAVSVDDFEARIYTNGQGESMPYRLFIPPGYDSSKSYPLVIYLHGNGREAGTDNIQQLSRWPAAMVFAEARSQENHPCFMVAPQYDKNRGQSWIDAGTLELFDAIIEIVKTEFSGIDSRRVYLTGISGGGRGALFIPLSYPGKYAGAVPMGGHVRSDSVDSINSLINFPFWGFWGENDGQVAPTFEAFVSEIEALGGMPRSTVYPGRGHLVWNPGAYAEPELVPWLFQFQLDGSASSPPSGLTVAALSHDHVELLWDASLDSESLILEYHVYRDTELVARVSADEFGKSAPVRFDDYDVEEDRSYSYSVLAVNAGNIWSEPTIAVTVQTPMDQLAPTIDWIGGGRDTVKVIFNEVVDPVSAGDESNYLLSDGIAIESVSVLPDSRSVLLNIEEVELGRQITLTVRNVSDTAIVPNSIGSNGIDTIFDNIPYENLAFWFQADQGLSIYEDGSVNHYVDQSENQVSQKQRVLVNRPTFHATRQNGQPVLRFDGVRQHLSLPDGFSDFTTGMTAIVTAKSTGINDGEQFFDFGIAGATSGIGVGGARPFHNFRMGRENRSNNLVYQVFDGIRTGGKVVAEAALEEELCQILSVTHDPGSAGQQTNVALYVNSLISGEGLIEVPRVINRTNNYIGRMNPLDVNSTEGQFLGEIGDVLIFNSKLSTQDREEIEQYLYNKYIGPGRINTPPVISVTVPSQINFEENAILSGEVSDDGDGGAGLTVSWSQFAGSGVARFQPDDSINTTVSFSMPGTYVLRVNAFDGELNTSRDITIEVLAEGLSFAGLVPFQVGDSNTNSNSMSQVASTGEWQLSGSGYGVDNSSQHSGDDLYFEQQLIGGDFSVTTRLHSVTNAASGSFQAGLMLRSGDDSASQFSLVGVGHSGRHIAGRRFVAGVDASIKESSDNYDFANLWLRITRVGNRIETFTSTDGISWLSRSVDSFASLDVSVRVGLFVSSGASEEIATASFSEFRITAPEVAAPEVLYVIGSGGIANAGEVALATFMEDRGMSVAFVEDSLSTSSDANGKRFVLISSSVASGNVNTKFRDVDAPVVVYENFLYDDMGMTGPVSGVDFGNTASQVQIDVVNSSDQLGAGFVGQTSVYSSNSFVTWGKPNSNAVTVATSSDTRDQATIFYYPRGSSMFGLAAPGPRIGYFFENDGGSVLTTDGVALFNSLLNYTLQESINHAPVVFIVGDKTLRLPEQLSLVAVVRDDGLPANGSLEFEWSGPAGASFSDTNSLTTTVSFAEAGTYNLLLTIQDGEFTITQEWPVEVDAIDLVHVGLTGSSLGGAQGSAVALPDGFWHIETSGDGIGGYSSVDSCESDVIFFEEDFDQLSPGPLVDRNGWSQTDGLQVTVQNSEAHQGAQSLQIKGDDDGSDVVGNTYVTSSEVVWTDFNLIAEPTSGDVALGSEITSAFFFDGDGYLNTYDGLTGEWLIPNGLGPVSLDSWQRLSVRSDYVEQTWSIWLNGELVASRLGFANSVTEGTGFTVSQESSGPAYIDAIAVRCNEPEGLTYRDGVHFESQSLTGEFDVRLQVRQLVGGETDAIAGLMVRESNDAGARFVSLGASAANIFVQQERTVIDSAATTMNVVGAFDFPDVWVRLRRSGDDITLYTSTNNADWLNQGDVTLVGLPHSVEVGVFVHSSHLENTAVATVDNYIVDETPSNLPEDRILSGEFDVRLQVRDLGNSQTDAIAGLILRESNDVGARFISLGASTTGSFVQQERSATAGEATSTNLSGTFNFPDAWVRLRRLGDTVVSYTSTRNGGWVNQGSVTLIGLPDTLRVGVFVHSMDPQNSSLATVDNFIVDEDPSRFLTKGMYFYRREYVDESLPDFEATRAQLPVPILDGETGWVDMYWKAWELAYQHYEKPSLSSGLVANYMDEAFDGDLYQWDTLFMVLFGRYNHETFSSIESLDNFYHAQRSNGFIARAFSEQSASSSLECVDCVNPPLFAWAEWENYQLTGDLERLSQVLLPLEKYAEWLELNRISEDAQHGLFWNTPLGSGMDNTPRSGSGWVDMSAQMSIQYHYIALIADALGLEEKAQLHQARADEIANLINQWMWDSSNGIYFDVEDDGTFNRSKTLGSFWPLLTNISNGAQNAELVAHLRNPDEFWRVIPFPTLAADEPQYDPLGGYWLGGVWAPTNYAIIKGLEVAGEEDLATEATEKYLEGIYQDFLSTNTFWENYAPDVQSAGNRGPRPDFVGWTGLGPIALLIENVIGLRPSAPEQKLTWMLQRTDRHGVEKYRMGDNLISLICEQRESEQDNCILTVTNTEAFTLVVNVDGLETVFSLSAGSHNLEVDVLSAIELWKTQYFTAQELSDFNISGDFADPDLDGISNLLEYALGLSPILVNSNPISLAQVQNGEQTYLELGYSRPENLNGLEYQVQMSNDLIHWVSGASVTELIELSTDGEWEELRVRDMFPVGLFDQRFMRLSVNPQTDIQISYEQNFDGLASAPISSDVAWEDAVTLPLWYSNRNQIRIADGSGGSLNSTGFARIISFGGVSSTDRALGATHHIFDGDTTVFGLKLVNTTGATINNIVISFDAEQWRRAGSVETSNQILFFDYSTEATDLTGVGFNRVPASDFHSIDDGASNIGGAGLNGNQVSLRGIKVSLSQVNWADGANLWLRWGDVNDSGNDHGLAIDNLKITILDEGVVLQVDSAGNVLPAN